MSWATAVVLIVLISAVAGVMRSRHSKRDRHEHNNQISQSEREAALQHEVEDLRERIQVLEKITVDGREARAIADEIERLRDRQEN